MTHVLIFGAGGFVGRSVRQAVEDDPRIAAVTCPGRDRCDLLRAGIDELAALLAAVRPDAVVNCTGRLAGSGYDLIEANTAVTAKLLEAVAVAVPTARLVRLGSAGEYGQVPHGRAVGEEYPAIPVSTYGVSHLAATRLVELAGAAGRVDGVVLRMFNPIGAGLHEENVLGRAAALFRRAADTGEDAISLGDLTAYRDFVDVRDVAAAVVAAIVVDALPERVFNVGSGHAVTTRQAVHLLADMAGFTGEIREEAATPTRSAAVGWMRADIDRAARVLGWAPAHELAASVKAVWTGACG
jgi:nucleoside-diphosphate-sugar epimerase